MVGIGAGQSWLPSRAGDCFCADTARPVSRRTLLRSGLTAVGALAGCGGEGTSRRDERQGPPEQDGDDMGLPKDLPPGRLITPTLWISDDKVPDVTTRWAAAQTTHPTTGWWPLLLTTDLGFGAANTETVDAERFLAEQWESDYRLQPYRLNTDPSAVEDIPYSTWPGLAPATVGAGPGPDAVAASIVTRPEIEAGRLSDPFNPQDTTAPDVLVPNPFVDGTGRARLGLVKTTDSAGAITASGWMHDTGAALAGCTAVLRSWQDRFGVRLCALGTDWFAVTVAWPVPPKATEHARRIAAEHVAFCPDILGHMSFAEYAKGLITATVWIFWWD